VPFKIPEVSQVLSEKVFPAGSDDRNPQKIPSPKAEKENEPDRRRLL